MKPISNDLPIWLADHPKDGLPVYMVIMEQEPLATIFQVLSMNGFSADEIRYCIMSGFGTIALDVQSEKIEFAPDFPELDGSTSLNIAREKIAVCICRYLKNVRPTVQVATVVLDQFNPLMMIFGIVTAE